MCRCACVCAYVYFCVCVDIYLLCTKWSLNIISIQNMCVLGSQSKYILIFCNMATVARVCVRVCVNVCIWSIHVCLCAGPHVHTDTVYHTRTHSEQFVWRLKKLTTPMNQTTFMSVPIRIWVWMCVYLCICCLIAFCINSRRRHCRIYL